MKTSTTQKFEWRDSALCKNLEPSVFYPDFRGMDIENYIANNLPCARCSVKNKCLEYALDNEEQGVWGGVYLRPTTMTVRAKKIDGQ